MNKKLKKARKELLAIANSYETRQRKFLKGVFFDERYGSYRWIGQAHNYSYFPEN